MRFSIAKIGVHFLLRLFSLRKLQGERQTGGRLPALVRTAGGCVVSFERTMVEETSAQHAPMLLNRRTIDNLFERRAYIFFFFPSFFFPPPFAKSEIIQQCDYDTMIPMMERILGKRISGTRHPNLYAHCKLITIRE